VFTTEVVEYPSWSIDEKKDSPGDRQGAETGGYPEKHRIPASTEEYGDHGLGRAAVLSLAGKVGKRSRMEDLPFLFGRRL
jgi:hypothetical protein